MMDQEILQKLDLIATAIKGLHNDGEMVVGVINLLLLAVTLIYLRKYTKATEALKNEAINQTILSVSPFLTIRAEDHTYYVENIGKGIAFNTQYPTPIKNKSCVYQIEEDKKLTSCMLRPGEKRKLCRVLTKVGKDKVSSSRRPPKEDLFVLEKQRLTIRFQDVLGNEYNIIYEVGLDEKNVHPRIKFVKSNFFNRKI